MISQPGGIPESGGFAWGEHITDERKDWLFRCYLGPWEEQAGHELRPHQDPLPWFPPVDGSPEALERRKQWTEAKNAGMPAGPFGQQLKWPLCGADVFWLASRALAGVGGDIPAAEEALGNSIYSVVRWRALDLFDLNLSGAAIQGAVLTRANLPGAQFRGALAEGAQMQGCYLHGTKWEDARLGHADFSGSIMSEATLRDAQLRGSLLQGTDLTRADLRGADLRGARLQGSNLTGADLRDVDLRNSVLSDETLLNGAQLDGASVDQVVWGNVHLTVIDWSKVRILGDERAAERPFEGTGEGEGRKTASERVEEYRAAARAHDALAVALNAQGVAAVGRRFHYRSEVLGRKATFHDARMRSNMSGPRNKLRAVRRWLGWAASWVFDAVSGYGSKIARLAGCYFVIVVAFAAVYLVLMNGGFGIRHVLNMIALSLSAFTAAVWWHKRLEYARIWYGRLALNR